MNKHRVAELLQRNTDGLTILEIARALRMSRNTVPVALAELKGEGLIRIRPVGRAKLHYWKKKERRGEAHI
jgi:DNA-binding GntR family transcriptional regulator